MNKICGYSCEHNKSGVCQISVCDKKSIISDKTEVQMLRLDKLDYTIIPNSDIKPLLDRLQQENKKLKDNWNKLKEFIEKDYDFYDKLIAPEYGCSMGALSRIKDKMQELEQGSDSNGQ